MNFSGTLIPKGISQTYVSSATITLPSTWFNFSLRNFRILYI